MLMPISAFGATTMFMKKNSCVYLRLPQQIMLLPFQALVSHCRAAVPEVQAVDVCFMHSIHPTVSLLKECMDSVSPVPLQAPPVPIQQSFGYAEAAFQPGACWSERPDAQWAAA